MPKKSMTKSKTVGVVNKDGVLIEMCHCRKCGLDKRPTEFYQATDRLLDQSGYMSVCKDCCRDLYVRFYKTSHTIENTILKLCRILNWKFSDAAIEATRKHLDTQNKSPDDESTIGIYRTKLTNSERKNLASEDSGETDLTFQEGGISIGTEFVNDDDFEEAVDLKEFWGTNYTFEEYTFLEKVKELWNGTYSHKTPAEEYYIKQVCYKELDLKRAREEDNTKSVDSIQKSMDLLLKGAALQPMQASVASNQSKLSDAWGLKMKMVENKMPGEVYKDKELFKDYDGIVRKYILPFITRPIINFMTGNRDFNVSEEDMEDEKYPDFINPIEEVGKE